MLLLVVLLALPPVFTVATVTLVVLAGAWEWSGFLQAGTRPLLRAAYVGLIALLICGALAHRRELAARAALIMRRRGAVVGRGAAVGARSPRSAPPRRPPALAGVLALVPAWLALVCMRLGGATGRSGSCSP